MPKRIKKFNQSFCVVLTPGKSEIRVREAWANEYFKGWLYYTYTHKDHTGSIIEITTVERDSYYYDSIHKKLWEYYKNGSWGNNAGEHYRIMSKSLTDAFTEAYENYMLEKHVLRIESHDKD